MTISKVTIKLDNGEEREYDCSALPSWVHWLAIKRTSGSVFAFERCSEEGGAGMYLRREPAKYEL